MSIPTRTKIKVVNPQISDNVRTYLTQDIDASPSSSQYLSIIAKRGFFRADRNNKSQYFILVGDYNQEKSEITMVSSDDTDDKRLLVNRLSNSHSAADPITQIDFDKIRVYGAYTPGGTMTLIYTINIDASQSFTEYVYETTSSTPYSYFATTYYNSAEDTETNFSEEVEGNTFTRRSIKRIIESAAVKALTRVEESPSAILNWNNCIDIAQDGIDEILVKKRNWQFLRTSYAGISTEARIQMVQKPSNINLLEFIRINDKKVDYVSRLRFLQLTEGKEMSFGEPMVYTEKDGMIYMFPTPDQAYQVIYDFYEIPAQFTELSDSVALPFVPILIYYCAAMFAYIRGNDKRGDKVYSMFIKLLEQQCEEYGGVEQTGDAEEIEATNSLYYEE